MEAKADLHGGQVSSPRMRELVEAVERVFIPECRRQMEQETILALRKITGVRGTVVHKVLE